MGRAQGWRRWSDFRGILLAFPVPRITPSQMSARSYRKPRSSKTQSSPAADAQGQDPPPVPVSWLLEQRSLWDPSPRGSSVPLGHSHRGAHCATLLPDRQAPAPSLPAALGPVLQQLSAAGAPEDGSRDWADGGAGGAGRGPPCLCSAAPSCSGRGRCLADEPETTSGAGALASPWAQRHCEGARSCQARPHPLPLPLSVCLWVGLLCVCQ